MLLVTDVFWSGVHILGTQPGFVGLKDLMRLAGVHSAKDAFKYWCLFALWKRFNVVCVLHISTLVALDA